MKEHITIAEIAKECGVSISTVSRVINGNVRVSPEKKERIEKVIMKYNFTPNTLAKGLVSKETKTLGVVIPDISNSYFSSMFLEIERAALEAGYSIILCNTLFGGSSHGIHNTKEESDYFQMLIDKQVDGILIIGGQVDLVNISESYKQELQRLSSHLPVVVIGRKIPDVDCIFIEHENGNGVSIALNYLYMLGHRKIAFIGGQMNVTITEIRLKAYRDTLKQLGLPEDPNLIALSDYYIEDGYTAMNRLLHSGADFTAFLAINDSVALGAARMLYDMKLQVPQDKAFISCDQFLNGNYYYPRLTSVNQHHELLGRIVVTTLINAIKGLAEPAKYTFTPELVIRESCGTMLGIRDFT